jgi:hypothetical protein
VAGDLRNTRVEQSGSDRAGTVSNIPERLSSLNSSERNGSLLVALRTASKCWQDAGVDIASTADPMGG